MRLVDASKEGRLSERGNVTLFDGVDREVIQGVNEMLDAILLPIGEGNRILSQISSGKIDELIAQTYKGDHEKMKVAVNNVAIVIQGLQKEMGRLSEASGEGQLSERGKPEHFQGAFAEIVRGVNVMLDAILLAHRRGQPHSLSNLFGQDRRTDCADLQGRPRENEAGGQQCRHRGAKPAKGNDAAHRGIQKGQLSTAASRSSSKVHLRRLCAASTRCSTRSCLPIGEGNAFSLKSRGQDRRMIAQTYKGDHEKMKLAVNNVASPSTP
jgi:methyl-accepting chemotaxis protein